MTYAEPLPPPPRPRMAIRQLSEGGTSHTAAPRRIVVLKVVESSAVPRRIVNGSRIIVTPSILAKPTAHGVAWDV